MALARATLNLDHEVEYLGSNSEGIFSRVGLDSALCNQISQLKEQVEREGLSVDEYRQAGKKRMRKNRFGIRGKARMCDLCEDNNGEMQSCQDCGRLICFDEFPSCVDVIDRAYVTASGDLMCTRCGREYDQAEEDEAEDDFYEPPFDPDLDDEETYE